MNSKPWFSSKINWVGLINIIAGVALYLAKDQTVKDLAPMIIPVLISINGAIVFIIRTFFTEQPVTMSFTGRHPEDV